ncbi:MAG: hypothetical protein WDN48_12110 [Pseudolabrys sp.]
MTRIKTKEMRRRVYQALEQGPVGERLGVALDRLLMVLIVINLVAVAIESVPSLDARYAVAFDVIEYFSLVVVHD